MNMTLIEIAPRLGLARDQFLAEQVERAAREIKISNKRMRLHWLIAHRDLQLHRAYATDSRKYIARRLRKLQEAQAELEALEASARLEQA